MSFQLRCTGAGGTATIPVSIVACPASIYDSCMDSPDQYEQAPRLFASRVSVAYCCIFAFAGISVPYFPLWLQFKGLSEFEIGVVLSAPVILRVLIAGPIVSFADSRPDRASFTIALYVASAMSMVFYIWNGGFWWILAITLLMTFFFNPVVPLVDAIAMSGVRRFGANYGRMRISGSVIFIVANLAGGYYLLDVAADYILFALIAVLAVGSGLMLALPRIGKRRLASGRLMDEFSFYRMLRMPRFMLVLLAAGILQASHALFYSFGSIYWQSLGYGGLTIGILWGIGVAAEIVLFQFGKWLIGAIGTIPLLVIGGVAAIARWVIFPLDPGLGGFLALQLLHGLTFGAVHIATMYFIMESVPEERIASAQGVGFAVSGLTSAMTVFAGGYIYQAIGVNGFWIMAGLAAIALVLIRFAMIFTPMGVLRRRGEI